MINKKVIQLDTLAPCLLISISYLETRVGYLNQASVEEKHNYSCMT
jgi:hypothetical protein